MADGKSWWFGQERDAAVKRAHPSPRGVASMVSADAVTLCRAMARACACGWTYEVVHRQGRKLAVIRQIQVLM